LQISWLVSSKFKPFVSQNHYLSGKNAVRFQPRGLQAKRYARLVCAQTTLCLIECFLSGNFVDLLCPGRIFSNQRITAVTLHCGHLICFVIFFTKIIILAERTQLAFSATRHGGETLATTLQDLMSKQLGVTIIVSSLLLSSCFDLFDSGSDNVVDDYDVIWIDLHENRYLCKREELVPAYVFAVGHNDNFIFAKQHPLIPKSEEIIDNAVTNYYLIERTENEFQDKPTYGPLSKTEFVSLCKKLKIDDVEFDMQYPTNLSWK
jgi:hypothetical protein